MARFSEIYPRNPDDPQYKVGKLHTDDEVEIIIGQIKIQSCIEKSLREMHTG